MIKKYLVLFTEGTLYGFFGGMLLWINLYLIYETHLSIIRNQVPLGINMSFMKFNIGFLGFCLWSMIVAFLMRLITDFFFQKYEQLFLSWLLIGVSLIAFHGWMLSNTSFSIIERRNVGYGQLCCIYDSTGYIQWLIMFLLIVLYTFLFTLVRKHILKSPF